MLTTALLSPHPLYKPIATTPAIFSLKTSFYTALFLVSNPERGRLSTELKSSGTNPGIALLGMLGTPTLCSHFFVVEVEKTMHRAKHTARIMLKTLTSTTYLMSVSISQAANSGCAELREGAQRSQAECFMV